MSENHQDPNVRKNNLNLQQMLDPNYVSMDKTQMKKNKQTPTDRKKTQETHQYNLIIIRINWLN